MIKLKLKKLKNKQMKSIKVKMESAPGENYKILVGKNILQDMNAQALVQLMKGAKISSVHIFYDQAVAGHVKTWLKQWSKDLPLFVTPLEVTEDLKSLQNIVPLYQRLLDCRADRDSLVIAIGGGVIGDALGFVASTYMRGIRWVGVPTTLLAQVDSSVGGKTGVNLPIGKNLVGTFHRPSLVIVDLKFLSTLPERDLVSGLGEIVKYALTFDAKFFQRLEKDWRKILKRDEEFLLECVSKCLKLKVKSVRDDEFDRKGQREILNFGHTVGHALESLTNYQTYRHGEAVIWGMRIATHLSHLRGHLHSSDAQRIEDHLQLIPVPALPKKIAIDDIMKSVKKDKKTTSGVTRFVLLDGIGRAFSDKKITPEILQTTLSKFFHHQKLTKK